MNRGRYRVALALVLTIVSMATGLVRAAGDFEVTTFVEPRSGLTDTQPFQFIIQLSGPNAVGAPFIARPLASQLLGTQEHRWSSSPCSRTTMSRRSRM